MTPKLNAVNHAAVTRGVGQHHGNLRRALLDAALGLVAEGDPDRLTLRAVARRAGVSPAAPYHHFADRDALLVEVAREGFAALAVAQDAALASAGPEGTATQRLRQLVVAYVRFALAHRTHYAVMTHMLPIWHDTVPEGSPAASRGAMPAEGPVGSPASALGATALGTFRRLVDAIRAVSPGLGHAAATRRALVAWAASHGAVAVAGWAPALASVDTTHAGTGDVGDGPPDGTGRDGVAEVAEVAERTGQRITREIAADVADQVVRLALEPA